MKKYVLIILCLFGFLLNNELMATHVMGGEFKCRVLDSVNRIYKVTLLLYRDCSGITPGNTAWNVNFSNGCPNMVLNATFVGKREISTLCSGFPVTTCRNPNATMKGSEEWEYQWVGQFPPNCGIAKITWDECCRNFNAGPGSIDPAIIDGTGPIGGHVEIWINTSLKRGNNSIQFLSSPIPYIAVNKKLIYNQEAVDPDGDSIAYSLYSPLGDASGSPVIYKPPYSSLRPFDMVETKINFNSDNGQMIFTPTKLQTSIMGVRATEYRRLKSFNKKDSFVLAGQVMRDIQLTILGVGDIVDVIGIIPNSIFGGNYKATDTILACPDSISFQIKGMAYGTNPNVTLELVTPKNVFAFSNPSLTYTTIRDTAKSIDTITGFFKTSLANMAPGCYDLVFQYNYCLSGAAFPRSYPVKVCIQSSGLDPIVDTFRHCAGGIIPELHVSKEFGVSWTPLARANFNIDSSKILFSPSTPTQYLIHFYSLGSYCDYQQVIWVDTSTKPNAHVSPVTSTLNYGQQVILQVVADTMFQPFTYQWSPKQYLKEFVHQDWNEKVVTSIPKDSMKYSVIVKDRNGCKVKLESNVHLNKTKLNVHVFFDGDSNGIQNNGEPNFNKGIFSLIRGSDSIKIIPDDHGNIQLFNAFFGMQYFKFTPYISSSKYRAVLSIDSAMASVGGVINVSVALRPIIVFRDLSIQMHSSIARIQASMMYTIFVNNNGPLRADSVFVKVDTHLLQKFVSSVPALHAVSNSNYLFFLDTLAPYSTRKMTLILLNASSPSLKLGDTLVKTAKIYSKHIDPDSADNFVKHKVIVRYSYDPNAKSESHLGAISKSEADERVFLNYFIQFQNLGTDTAFDVVVIDTIENSHDVESFEFLQSSHSCQTTITYNNEINFNFENIRLPDNKVNEPASQGWITYRIRPKQGLQVGDQLRNSASIYFDYNEPIKTNTNIITVYLPKASPLDTTKIDSNKLSKIEYPASYPLKVYPVPAKDIIHVEFNQQETIQSLVLFDVHGGKVNNAQLNNFKSMENGLSIHIQSLPTGPYILHVTTENNRYNLRILKE